MGGRSFSGDESIAQRRNGLVIMSLAEWKRWSILSWRPLHRDGSFMSGLIFRGNSSNQLLSWRSSSWETLRMLDKDWKSYEGLSLDAGWRPRLRLVQSLPYIVWCTLFSRRRTESSARKRCVSSASWFAKLGKGVRSMTCSMPLRGKWCSAIRSLPDQCQYNFHLSSRVRN